MTALSHREIVLMLLGLALLLGLARLLGELARKLNQPSVAGELLAGIILGPTVLGSLLPEANAELFPQSGNLRIVMAGLSVVSVVLFLFVAGLEVNLSVVRQQSKVALSVGTTGLLFPFALGFYCGYYHGGTFGAQPSADRLIFALFLATALSISALPVIAKILMDLKLYRSELGLIIISSAMLDDLSGWIVFSLILGMMDAKANQASSVGLTLVFTISFAAFILTIGRSIINAGLAWVQARASRPGGTLGFAITLAFVFAAITEAIGIHAIFGAFLFGVALGDSKHLGERARITIEQVVTFIVAPIFFATVGLRVNFIEHFDLPLFIYITAIATFCKLVGCSLGARLAGMSGRQSLAIGSALNARGAMEIILGLLALQAGLIDNRMFVALVLMALFTSMSAGFLIQRFLLRPVAIKFTSFLTPRSFVRELEARDRQSAILELAQALCAGTSLDPTVVAETVLAKGRVRLTGLTNGLAVPHAKILGIDLPIVAIGLSRPGIDFDSPDGKPSHLIALILSPENDHTSQLDLFSDINRTFYDRGSIRRVLNSSSYTEFLSFVNSSETKAH